jgi:outer membrane protein OmpA-like peptidoglycan-associated protein
MKSRTHGVQVTCTLGLIIVSGIAETAFAAQADQKASKQETTGVVTGLAVGAAAGGPVGAIFGAAAGAWLGDRYHRKEVERQALAANLEASQSKDRQLGVEMQRLNLTLAQSESLSTRYETTVEMTRDLEASVPFRTGDATLREDSVAALRKLAALLVTLPDTEARIEGFADARGSKALNLELSMRRASAVREVLVAAGVDPDRVILEAHGKALAIAEPNDVDGSALERRVTVTLEPSVPRVSALAARSPAS